MLKIVKPNSSTTLGQCRPGDIVKILEGNYYGKTLIVCPQNSLTPGIISTHNVPVVEFDLNGSMVGFNGFGNVLLVEVIGKLVLEV